MRARRGYCTDGRLSALLNPRLHATGKDRRDTAEARRLWNNKPTTPFSYEIESRQAGMGMGMGGVTRNNAVPGGGQHLPQPDPVGRPLVGDAGVRDGLDQHSGGAVGCAGPARFKEQLPHGGWDGADALADLAGAPLMSCVVGVGRGARESTACQCVAIRPSPDPRSRHNTHNGEEAFLFFPSTKDEPQAVRKRRDWRQRTQHGRGLARLAPCTLRARARQSTLRTSQKPTRRHIRIRPPQHHSKPRSLIPQARRQRTRAHSAVP